MLYVQAGSARIPDLGMGTWQLKGATCRDAVTAALELGYRHLDTAQAYENEADVGAALAESGVPRDEVFVTTKVWYEQARRDDLLKSVDASLRRLKLDHVDLLLLHWPNAEVPLAESMGALDEAVERGLTRSIGVSNFPSAMLRNALELAPLVVNQVEYHPYLRQDEVAAVCRARGMAMVAYSPIAQGRVFDDATLRAIGAPHGKSGGQVALRWLLQQSGVVAIPRSSKRAHLAANIDIFDFELDAAEMRTIGHLGEGRRLIDPDWAPEWD
jgi:2,5-diketo-D-gluconate reductase B